MLKRVSGGGGGGGEGKGGGRVIFLGFRSNRCMGIYVPGAGPKTTYYICQTPIV